MVKNQAEVSGSGRKPAPQKGRGMARVGNSRSNLQRKGGKQFGERPREFYFPINNKLRLKGLMTVLTMKLVEKKVIVVSGLNLTKEADIEFIKNEPKFLMGNSALFVDLAETDLKLKTRKTKNSRVNIVNPKVTF